MSPVVAPTAGILIRDRVGNDVLGTNSFYVAPVEDTYEADDEMTVDFDIALNLGAGAYTLTVAVHGDAGHLVNNYGCWDKVIGFQIVPRPQPFFIGSAWLPVRLRVEWRLKIVASGHRPDGEHP